MGILHHQRLWSKFFFIENKTIFKFKFNVQYVSTFLSKVSEKTVYDICLLVINKVQQV